MDGLLIVDKPSGPSSHDIVARARRILKERRIGHTGTLDPLASGVLPLVVGRATRLVRFLDGEKAYEATVRLGFATDTRDCQGTIVGSKWLGTWPSSDEIAQALNAFRGTFSQRPPAFSAKKVGGKRSYELARRESTRAAAAVARPGLPGLPDLPGLPGPPGLQAPAPVDVTVHALQVLDVDGSLVRMHVRCSAGFYVRSLAHDLGEALGVGAHLEALRRTSSAGFDLSLAVPLARLEEADGREVAERSLIPMNRMLTRLPGVTLTPEGLAHTRVGRELGPADAARGFVEAMHAIERGREGREGREGRDGQDAAVFVRLLDETGQLIAIADRGRTPGSLHPAVVLM